MPHVKSLLLIIPAMLALAFVGLRQRHLLESSEGRVARVAQEMLDTGDWVVPHLNGEVRKEKPAFSSWCVALTALISGSDHVEALHAFVPPGLAALGLVLLAYAWAAREKRNPDSPALFPMLAAVLLAGVPGFLLQARSAELDLMLAFFVALAYWGFYTYRVSGCVRALLIGYAALALGIHTKAHVVLVLTVPPLVVWHIWERSRLALPLPKPGAFRWHLLGVGVVLLLVLPYAVLFIQQSHITWADFNREGGTARFDDSRTGHLEPWYWYFVQVPGWFLPWFVLLPVVLVLNRNEPPDSRSPLRRLCWLWFGMNLLLFSVLSAKQRHYAVPFFFPLALLIADGVERCYARSRLTPRIIGAIFLLLAITIPILGWRFSENSLFVDVIPPIARAVAVSTGVACLITAICWLRARPLFLTWWLTLIGIVALRFLLIESKETYEASPARFCENVRRTVPDSAPLYDLGVASGSVYRAQVLFYLRRNVIHPKFDLDTPDGEPRPDRMGAYLTDLLEKASSAVYVLTNEAVLAKVPPDLYERGPAESNFLGHMKSKTGVYDVVLIKSKSAPAAP